MSRGAGVPSYRGLDLSVRPTRCAVLMEDVDGWQATATRIIESFTRTWGGIGSILVPISSQGEIPEWFWPILELFDPDRMGYYIPTHRDRQLRDREGYETWAHAEAQRLAGESSMPANEFLRQLLSESFLSGPTTDWNPPASLSAEVLRRLSPLHDEQSAFVTHYWADMGPGYGLVDMLNIESLGEEAIATFDLEALHPSLKLALMMRVGRLAPGYESGLGKLGVSVESVGIQQSDLCDFMNVAWADRPTGGATWASTDYFRRTPLKRTMEGCAWLVPGLNPYRPKWPFAVVLGDDAGDFCLALALDRLLGTSLWLPVEILNVEEPRRTEVLSCYAGAIGYLTQWGHGNAEAFLTSTSLPQDQINTLADEMTSRTTMSHSWFSIGEVGDLELPPFPQRLYDEKVWGVVRYEPFFDEKLAGRLETPLPTRIRAAKSSDLTWQVDIAVHGYQLPARAVLNSRLLTGEGFDRDIRSGREAISYFSQTALVLGGYPLEKTVVRPQVRLPEAKECVQILLSEAGLRAELSAAGQFTAGAIELWGGLNKLAETFLTVSTNSLLEAYGAKSRSAVDPGVYISTLKRRFLSIDDIQVASGLGEEEARALTDSWLGREILSRGLALLCPECSFANWYPLDELGQSFRCGRCRKESLINQRAWKKPLAEPLWYYALAEIAYQAVANDSRAPILALRNLSQKARAFLFVPEMDIWKEASHLGEVDLWVIRDGTVLVGEANTTGRLGESAAKESEVVSRLVRVADATLAGQVVLATTQASWQESAVTAVTTALQGRRAEPTFVTGLGSS